MSNETMPTTKTKTKATAAAKQETLSAAALMLASFAGRTPAEVAATELMDVLSIEGSPEEKKAILLAIQEATAKAKGVDPQSSLDLPPLAIEASEAGHVVVRHSMISGPGNRFSLATFAKLLRDVEALKAGVVANFGRLRVEQERDLPTILAILSKHGVTVPADVRPIIGSFPKVERSTKAEVQAAAAAAKQPLQQQAAAKPAEAPPAA